MSTTTLSQRLRDLKAMCITHGERHSIPNETAHWLMVGAVDELEKAIAQAEAQEAQAGELSGDFPPIPSMQEVIDNCEAPSQAIGEQTPVGWMKRDTTSDMLPESALELVMEPGAAAYIRKTWMPLYTSPLSPEARDRAIEMLCGISHVNTVYGPSPTHNDAIRAMHEMNAFAIKALSALRVTKGD